MGDALYYKRDDYIFNNQDFFCEIIEFLKIIFESKKILRNHNGGFESSIKKIIDWKFVISYNGILNFHQDLFFVSKDLFFNTSEKLNLRLKIIRKLKKRRQLELVQ